VVEYLVLLVVSLIDGRPRDIKTLVLCTERKPKRYISCGRKWRGRESVVLPSFSVCTDRKSKDKDVKVLNLSGVGPIVRTGSAFGVGFCFSF
jgi:hypothetical protein